MAQGGCEEGQRMGPLSAALNGEAFKAPHLEAAFAAFIFAGGWPVAAVVVFFFS